MSEKNEPHQTNCVCKWIKDEKEEFLGEETSHKNNNKNIMFTNKSLDRNFENCYTKPTSKADNSFPACAAVKRMSNNYELDEK